MSTLVTFFSAEGTTAKVADIILSQRRQNYEK